jgi:hypothetical protein
MVSHISLLYLLGIEPKSLEALELMLDASGFGWVVAAVQEQRAATIMFSWLA